ncbi:MAG TPA: PPC domain-containing DNA-binding protein [Actinomycetales bacterium]|nr:PPC domain-containing DNA-binding protein [Actinomycetales bacterium]
MQHKLIEDENGWATVVAIVDAGDEAVSCLTDAARAHDLSAASVTGVGAVEHATVGWYDLDRQEYEQIEVDEQAELLSLVGDVARGPDGSVALHAHVVLGLRTGETRGGHLLEATVRPTLEAVFRQSPAQLRKTFRPEFGLALIDLDQSTED